MYTSKMSKTLTVWLKIGKRTYFVNLKLCAKMGASSFSSFFLMIFRGGRFGFNLIIVGARRYSRYRTTAPAQVHSRALFHMVYSLVFSTNGVVNTIGKFTLNHHL